MMRVKIRAFAAVRDALGTGELMLELAAGARVADALAQLSAAQPAAGLAERRFATAVNRVFVGLEQALADGDELALIPPVSGG